MRMLIACLAIITVSICAFDECYSRTIGVVHLTNSEFIRGTIIEMIPDEPVVLETREGKQYNFPIELIDRVEAVEITAQDQFNSIGIVHKKGGETLRGVIIEMTPGKSLKLETLEGELFEYSMEIIVKVILLEIKSKKHEIYDGPRKSPGLAIVLSIFVGGGGQFYNGDYLKGMIVLPCWIVGGTCGLGLMASTIIDPDEEPDEALVLGAAVGGGVWIYSIIDAQSTANRLNRERGYTIFDVPVKDNLVLSPKTVNYSNYKFEPGLKLTYSF